MNIGRIIGIVVSLLALVASVIVGFFFFGVIAASILGIVLLFILLSVLMALNRRWKTWLLALRERLNTKPKKTKKKGRWEGSEEVVVGHIEEKK